MNATSHVTASCVWPLAAQLGEGPVWLPEEQAIWFVDIKKPAVHRFEVGLGVGHTWSAPEPIGFVMPQQEGGFIAGLKSGLHGFDPSTGRFTPLRSIEPPALDNRLNDACVDGAGRLWFGSMHDGQKNPSGALYRLDGSGTLSRVDAGYCISNGPAFSPDGRTFYHTDSPARTLYAFDCSAAGELSNKRVFIKVDERSGYPDGTTVDCDGCLWVALYGGWGLARYSPDGRLIGRIRLPVENVTKPVFGDDDLQSLYITTASAGLTAAQRAAQPLAGGLFRLRPGVKGLPAHRVSAVFSNWSFR
jgi:xylono-1,5-lactonase